MSWLEKAKQHWLAVGLMVVVVVGGGWWYRGRQTAAGPIQYATAQASKQSLISTINGSGQVSALNQIDLKPANSGTVTSIAVKAGQQVKAGALIATLDQRSAAVAVEQAKASVESAQANYDKVASGASSDDPAVVTAQQAVTAAEQALQNAQNNVVLVQKQQDTAVANAYRSLLNSGLKPVQVIEPYSSPSVTDSDAPTLSGVYSGNDEGSYVVTQQGPYFSVSGLENQPLTKFDARLTYPLGTHGLFIQFTSDNISAAWQIDIPNKAASTYLSSYNSYQSALQSRDSALASANNQVQTAQDNLTQAQTALQQKMSPGAKADIATAKAQLDSAKAQLASAYNQYSSNRVVAPFDGVIAKVAVAVGDQAGGATAVATIITQQKIATVTLNEIDVAKIKLGDEATLTFDAVPDLSLSGKISQIDAVGTVSQGVVNYTVQIVFDTQDDRIKPGMSARATIITAMKPDVLAVPAAAIHTQNGQSTVQVVEASQIDTQDSATGYVTLKSSPTVQPVTIGITNGTLTEITDGLKEGDVVVTQTIDPSKTKTTTGSNSSLRIPGLGGGGGFGGGAGGFRGATGR